MKSYEIHYQRHGELEMTFLTRCESSTAAHRKCGNHNDQMRRACGDEPVDMIYYVIEHTWTLASSRVCPAE